MANRFSIEAIIKAVDKISAPIRKMQKSVSGFALKAAKAMKRLDRAIGKVVSGLKRAGSIALKGVTVGVGAATAAVVSFTREFSKIENAEAAFTPLLGGAEAAKRVVDLLNETAATTPFRFEQLGSATNMLLGMGVATEKSVIPMIRMLGDTAGGSADKLNGIALAFSQIQAAGKANIIDINQLINNGVPILAELAEMWEVNVGVAREMVTAGRATGDEVTKAFEKMTSKGGRFYRGMEIASKTTTGLWSTLLDNIGQAQAAIGEALSPVVKELIVDLTGVAKWVRKWAKAQKDIIGSNAAEYYQKIKTNLEEIIDTFKTIGKAIATFIALIATIKALTAVMIAFNIVATANPIGLIILGITALIGAIAVLIIWWDDLKDKMAEVFKWFIKLNPLTSGLGFTVDVFSAMKDLFFGNDDTNSGQTQGGTGQMVSPQERVARTIQETRNTDKAEVTIKDETGRAEVTSGTLGRVLNLHQSGAF